MRILAFTNSLDVTVDIVQSYCLSNVDFMRVDSDNPKSLPIEFGAGERNSLVPTDVIWYRRPFEALSDENDVESIVYRQEMEEMIWSYFLQYEQSIWVNYPTKNWISERKIIQLRDAPKYGLNVPDWCISSDKTKIESFVAKHEGSCLVKPINNGFINHGSGISLIYATKLTDVIDLNYASNCPTLIQNIIDKKYDVRTLYVDGSVLYFRMESNNLDVRIDQMKDVKYSIVQPPYNIDVAYKQFIHSQGLRFSTSDFVVNQNDDWIFLENNPNGNWVWIEEYFPGIVIEHFIKSLKVMSC